MKRMLLLSLCLALAMAANARDVTLRFTSPSSDQREEVVELDAAALRQKMGTDGKTRLRVLNAFGQDVPCQLTHDGKFLVYVSVRPGTITSLTVKEGSPTAPVSAWVGGNYFPNRAEDIAWENDRGAYRVYGPSLQRAGEKAYGIDVWTKCVPTPILEHRYLMDRFGFDYRNECKKIDGTQHLADSVYRLASFHLDHGDGLDAYAVGPSLGCGAPALVQDDRLLFPYCYRRYRILDNGPLRFTLELTFEPKTVGGDVGVTEHRVISLDRGSNFNRCELWYEGLTQPMPLAAGVVVHTADTQSLTLTQHAVLYADPTDRPDKLGCRVYVGVLFPGTVVKTSLMASHEADDIAGNAVGIATYRPQSHFVYYFGSAWSSADVRTFAAWQLRAQETLEAITRPLRCTME